MPHENINVVGKAIKKYFNFYLDRGEVTGSPFIYSVQFFIFMPANCSRKYFYKLFKNNYYGYNINYLSIHAFSGIFYALVLVHAEREIYGEINHFL